MLKNTDWQVWLKAITALVLVLVLAYMVFTNNPHTDHAIRALLIILSINQGAQSIAQARNNK